MQTEDIKNDLKVKIKKLEIEGLLSCAIIGSFQYNRILERVNDVDIIIIVDEVTAENISQIKEGFKKIARELEEKYVKTTIFPEFRISPIKPVGTKGKKVIQLHVLTYRRKIWKSPGREAFVLDANMNNEYILGKPLIKINKLRSLSKRDILDELEDNKKSIMSGLSPKREYIINGKDVKEVKGRVHIKGEAYLESILYHLIISFLNYLRFKNPKIKKKKIVLIEKARKILPKKYSDLIIKTYKIKDSIRNYKKKIRKKDIALLRKEGREFIDFLINSIL